MPCPNYKSNKIRHLKVHVTKPIGAKKNQCLDCKLYYNSIDQTDKQINKTNN